MAAADPPYLPEWVVYKAASQAFSEGMQDLLLGLVEKQDVVDLANQRNVAWVAFETKFRRE